MVNHTLNSTTYLINSWRALKARFQNLVGAISESRTVGNRNSLLQRESTDNEPTNPIYEIRSKIIPFCTVCLIVITFSMSSYAGEANDLAFILKVNPIIKEKPQNVSHFNPLETSELKFAATGLIRLYQKFVSSQDGPSCNFTPTCSRFGMACIQEFGMLRGILLTADRLIRCNGLESTHYHKDPSTGKYIDPITDYDH